MNTQLPLFLSPSPESLAFSESLANEKMNKNFVMADPTYKNEMKSFSQKIRNEKSKNVSRYEFLAKERSIQQSTSIQIEHESFFLREKIKKAQSSFGSTVKSDNSFTSIYEDALDLWVSSMHDEFFADISSKPHLSKRVIIFQNNQLEQSIAHVPVQQKYISKELSETLDLHSQSSLPSSLFSTNVSVVQICAINKLFSQLSNSISKMVNNFDTVKIGIRVIDGFGIPNESPSKEQFNTSKFGFSRNQDYELVIKLTPRYWTFKYDFKTRKFSSENDINVFSVPMDSLQNFANETLAFLTSYSLDIKTNISSYLRSPSVDTDTTDKEEEEGAEKEVHDNLLKHLPIDVSKLAMKNCSISWSVGERYIMEIYQLSIEVFFMNYSRFPFIDLKVRFPSCWFFPKLFFSDSLKNKLGTEISSISASLLKDIGDEDEYTDGVEMFSLTIRPENKKEFETYLKVKKHLIDIYNWIIFCKSAIHVVTSEEFSNYTWKFVKIINGDLRMKMLKSEEIDQVISPANIFKILVNQQKLVNADAIITIQNEDTDFPPQSSIPRANQTLSSKSPPPFFYDESDTGSVFSSSSSESATLENSEIFVIFPNFNIDRKFSSDRFDFAEWINEVLVVQSIKMKKAREDLIKTFGDAFKLPQDGGLFILKDLEEKINFQNSRTMNFILKRVKRETFENVDILETFENVLNDTQFAPSAVLQRLINQDKDKRIDLLANFLTQISAYVFNISLHTQVVCNWSDLKLRTQYGRFSNPNMMLNEISTQRPPFIDPSFGYYKQRLEVDHFKREKSGIREELVYSLLKNQNLIPSKRKKDNDDIDNKILSLNEEEPRYLANLEKIFPFYDNLDLTRSTRVIAKYFYPSLIMNSLMRKLIYAKVFYSLSLKLIESILYLIYLYFGGGSNPKYRPFRKDLNTREDIDMNISDLIENLLAVKKIKDLESLSKIFYLAKCLEAFFCDSVKDKDECMEHVIQFLVWVFIRISDDPKKTMIVNQFNVNFSFTLFESNSFEKFVKQTSVKQKNPEISSLPSSEGDKINTEPDNSSNDEEVLTRNVKEKDDKEKTKKKSLSEIQFKSVEELLEWEKKRKSKFKDIAINSVNLGLHDKPQTLSCINKQMKTQGIRFKAVEELLSKQKFDEKIISYWKSRREREALISNQIDEFEKETKEFQQNPSRDQILLKKYPEIAILQNISILPDVEPGNVPVNSIEISDNGKMEKNARENLPETMPPSLSTTSEQFENVSFFEQLKEIETVEKKESITKIRKLKILLEKSIIDVFDSFSCLRDTNVVNGKKIKQSYSIETVNRILVSCFLTLFNFFDNRQKSLPSQRLHKINERGGKTKILHGMNRNFEFEISDNNASETVVDVDDNDWPVYQYRQFLFSEIIAIKKNSLSNEKKFLEIIKKTNRPICSTLDFCASILLSFQTRLFVENNNSKNKNINYTIQEMREKNEQRLLKIFKVDSLNMLLYGIDNNDDQRLSSIGVDNDDKNFEIMLQFITNLQNYCENNTFWNSSKQLSDLRDSILGDNETRRKYIIELLTTQQFVDLSLKQYSIDSTLSNFKTSDNNNDKSKHTHAEEEEDVEEKEVKKHNDVMFFGENLLLCERDKPETMLTTKVFYLPHSRTILPLLPDKMRFRNATTDEDIVQQISSYSNWNEPKEKFSIVDLKNHDDSFPRDSFALDERIENSIILDSFVFNSPVDGNTSTTPTILNEFSLKGLYFVFSKSLFKHLAQNTDFTDRSLDLLVAIVVVNSEIKEFLEINQISLVSLIQYIIDGIGNVSEKYRINILDGSEFKTKLFSSIKMTTSDFRNSKLILDEKRFFENISYGKNAIYKNKNIQYLWDQRKNKSISIDLKKKNVTEPLKEFFFYFGEQETRKFRFLFGSYITSSSSYANYIWEKYFESRNDLNSSFMRISQNLFGKILAHNSSSSSSQSEEDIQNEADIPIKLVYSIPKIVRRSENEKESEKKFNIGEDSTINELSRQFISYIYFMDHVFQILKPLTQNLEWKSNISYYQYMLELFLKFSFGFLNKPKVESLDRWLDQTFFPSDEVLENDKESEIGDHVNLIFENDIPNLMIRCFMRNPLVMKKFDEEQKKTLKSLSNNQKDEEGEEEEISPTVNAIYRKCLQKTFEDRENILKWIERICKIIRFSSDKNVTSVNISSAKFVHEETYTRNDQNEDFYFDALDKDASGIFKPSNPFEASVKQVAKDIFGEIKEQQRTLDIFNDTTMPIQTETEALDRLQEYQNGDGDLDASRTELYSILIREEVAELVIFMKEWFEIEPRGLKTFLSKKGYVYENDGLLLDDIKTLCSYIIGLFQKRTRDKTWDFRRNEEIWNGTVKTKKRKNKFSRKNSDNENEYDDVEKDEAAEEKGEEEEEDDDDDEGEEEEDEDEISNLKTLKKKAKTEKIVLDVGKSMKKLLGEKPQGLTKVSRKNLYNIFLELSKFVVVTEAVENFFGSGRIEDWIAGSALYNITENVFSDFRDISKEQFFDAVSDYGDEVMKINQTKKLSAEEKIEQEQSIRVKIEKKLNEISKGTLSFLLPTTKNKLLKRATDAENNYYTPITLKKAIKEKGNPKVAKKIAFTLMKIDAFDTSRKQEESVGNEDSDKSVLWPLRIPIVKTVEEANRFISEFEKTKTFELTVPDESEIILTLTFSIGKKGAIQYFAPSEKSIEKEIVANFDEKNKKGSGGLFSRIFKIRDFFDWILFSKSDIQDDDYDEKKRKSVGAFLKKTVFILVKIELPSYKKKGEKKMYCYYEPTKWI